MVSPIIKDWGKQENDSCLMCIEFHFCKEKMSGNGGGDGCTTAWRHLMILNCTLTIVKIVSYMSWFLTIILKNLLYLYIHFFFSSSCLVKFIVFATVLTFPYLFSPGGISSLYIPSKYQYQCINIFIQITAIECQQNVGTFVSTREKWPVVQECFNLTAQNITKVYISTSL